MSNDAISTRMKKYEYITRIHLTPRTPAILRIDGRSFHTFTRGFKQPFDEVLINSMLSTMLYLCKNIQGCVLGYTQSDEISLVLVDYQTLETVPWFDNNVQKMTSVSASMATLEFNRAFGYEYDALDATVPEDDDTTYMERLFIAKEHGAMFDSRAFNLPKEEVCNYLLWRQKDAVRNSIQMVGHANFSHSVLHKKSSQDIVDMLRDEKGIDWEEMPTHLRRGACCIKTKSENDIRPKWEIDYATPLFTGDDRSYVENLIYVGE